MLLAIKNHIKKKKSSHLLQQDPINDELLGSTSYFKFNQLRTQTAIHRPRKTCYTEQTLIMSTLTEFKLSREAYIHINA